MGNPIGKLNHKPVQQIKQPWVSRNYNNNATKTGTDKQLGTIKHTE